MYKIYIYYEENYYCIKEFIEENLLFYKRITIIENGSSISLY